VEEEEAVGGVFFGPGQPGILLQLNKEGGDEGEESRPFVTLTYAEGLEGKVRH